MSQNPFLFPNVGGAPGSVPITRDPAQAPDPQGSTQTEDFSKLLKAELGQSSTQNPASLDPKAPLKYSAHAASRVKSRNIDTSPEQMRRINDAVDKAAAKGLDDTLVLTPDAAFIISVKNRTIITVMDRDQLQGNVFTNIDGAVIA